jgi:hypothetical protein
VIAMNDIVPFLIVVAILAVIMLAALVMVIIGIHGDERHMSLTDEPRSLSAIVARRIIGAHSDYHQRAGAASAERCRCR